MDDLMKLCDKLENCSKNEACYKNEILCTKKIVQSYVDGDDNKKLKLKAQIKQYETGINKSMNESFSLIITADALAIAGINLMVSVADEDIGKNGQLAVDVLIIVLVLFGIVFVLALIGQWAIKKYGNRDKWKKYIEVVLEDMENTKENKD